MKTIKRIVLLVLISSIITTFSCTKEGKQGETGPAGANGINGTNGTDGNANVKSETFTIYTTDWITGTNLKYVNEITSLITTDIVNTGGVMLYVESASGNSWLALPNIYLAGSNSETIRFFHSVGNVQIQIVKESGVPTITSNMRFKLVVFSSSARLSNPHIDYNNYYEVKGAFNLKD